MERACGWFIWWLSRHFSHPFGSVQPACCFYPQAIRELMVANRATAGSGVLSQPMMSGRHSKLASNSLRLIAGKLLLQPHPHEPLPESLPVCWLAQDWVATPVTVANEMGLHFDKWEASLKPGLGLDFLKQIGRKAVHFWTENRAKTLELVPRCCQE